LIILELKSSSSSSSSLSKSLAFVGVRYFFSIFDMVRFASLPPYPLSESSSCFLFLVLLVPVEVVFELATLLGVTISFPLVSKSCLSTLLRAPLGVLVNAANFFLNSSASFSLKLRLVFFVERPVFFDLDFFLDFLFLEDLRSLDELPDDELLEDELSEDSSLSSAFVAFPLFAPPFPFPGGTSSASFE